MSEVSRRDFLAGITATGVATLGGRFALGAEPAKIKKGSDLAKLGRTGLQPTVLGMGTGTVSGTQQRALGFDGFTKLMRYGLDRGLRYIDTADAYKTHPFVRRALEGVPSRQVLHPDEDLGQGPREGPRPTSSDSSRNSTPTTWTRC